MKFYKRDPDKALAGMAELNLQQRGAYNSLIDLLYARDGDVPDDDARVARMIYCHRSEWKAVKRQLMALGKVWVEDGKLHAKRVQTTIKEATNFGQTQRKRVANRWQKYENASENNEPPIRVGNTNTATATATATEESKKVVAAAVPAAPANKATRWPPDAVIPQGWLADADGIRRSHGLADIDLALEAERFGNYWSSKSGKDATKISWRKTWINWALNAKQVSHGHGRQSANDKFLAGAAEAIRKALGPTEDGDSNIIVGPFGRPLLPP